MIPQLLFANQHNSHESVFANHSHHKSHGEHADHEEEDQTSEAMSSSASSNNSPLHSSSSSHRDHSIKHKDTDRPFKRQKSFTHCNQDGEEDDDATEEPTVSSSSFHSNSSSYDNVWGHASFASASTPNNSSSRSVHFAPITQIHSTEWSPEEVATSWYTKQELANLKLERKVFVRALKKVDFDLARLDQSEHCVRGYEAYCSVAANKEYKAKRQMVWSAVLQEQQRQRFQLGRQQQQSQSQSQQRSSVPDPFMMQLVSAHATQWARDTATQLGVRDAQVALQIFMEFMQQQQQQQPPLLEEEEDEYDWDAEDEYASDSHMVDDDLILMEAPKGGWPEDKDPVDSTDCHRHQRSSSI